MQEHHRDIRGLIITLVNHVNLFKNIDFSTQWGSTMQ